MEPPVAMPLLYLKSCTKLNDFRWMPSASEIMDQIGTDDVDMMGNSAFDS